MLAMAPFADNSRLIPVCISMVLWVWWKTRETTALWNESLEVHLDIQSKELSDD
jgi:hypothetical protein